MDINKNKVLSLAKLARIEIEDEEAVNLSKEFKAILGYVSEIKSAESKVDDLRSKDKNDYAVRNVTREDGEAHEEGLYTKDILSQAPAREGNFIKVKKIL